MTEASPTLSDYDHIIVAMSGGKDSIACLLHLLDAGADLVTAQKLMGHSNPSTTAGYDRRTEKAKRKAVAALSVPYTRRFRNGNGKDKTA